MARLWIKRLRWTRRLQWILPTVLLCGVAHASPQIGVVLPPGKLELKHAQKHVLQHRDELARRAVQFTMGGDSLPYKVLLQSSTVDVDPVTQSVTSISVAQLENNTGVLSSLYISLQEMEPGVQIDVSDDQGPLAWFDQQGVIQVTLRNPLDVGGQVTLTISVAGKPQCSGQFLGITGCVLSPALTYSVSGAWVPRYYAVTSQAWLPIDPVQSAIALTLPNNLSLGTLDTLTGASENGDGTTTYSLQGGEGQSGFAFSAGPFVEKQHVSAGGVPVITYLTDGPNATGWGQVTGEIVDFHASRYGPYPFSKMSLIEIGNTDGTAFGPASGVFLPNLFTENVPAHWQSAFTLAHEVGHQWFPGSYVLGDQLSPWISEGFASLVAIDFIGVESLKEGTVDWSTRYRPYYNNLYLYNVPPTEDVPITSYQIYQVSGQSYFALTYAKGMLVAGMLREAAGGRQPFEQGFLAFRAAHQSTPGDVTSLQTHMEQQSGKDLSAFFNKFVHGSGFPVYKVGFEATGSGEQIATTVTIQDDQGFGAPLEMQVFLADGTKEIVTVAAPKAGVPAMWLHTGVAVVGVIVDPNQKRVGRVRSTQVGDLFVDGAVDGIDLIYVARSIGGDALGQSQSTWFREEYDLVVDGLLDDKDLQQVISNFGGGQ